MSDKELVFWIHDEAHKELFNNSTIKRQLNKKTTQLGLDEEFERYFSK